LRKLTAGEAAVMPVRIRSDRGVNSKSAPLVASDARAIAARFPNEPSVQSALAEAEYDARNYAAAEAAADRALAANPKDIHALIYKGRARLEMAKANPAKADWSEVRSWFSRANKLDTEDAEPLMLFYKSSLDAGQTPTKNAVEALLDALTLVPQDDTLRINAVRQMLTDGRLAEAKELFAPLAFNPHADERWREIASSVMQAIASGDGKKASALLNQRQQPQPAAGAN
jgi:tetratricopeptide (TPR) repeat protein